MASNDVPAKPLLCICILMYGFFGVGIHILKLPDYGKGLSIFSTTRRQRISCGRWDRLRGGGPGSVCGPPHLGSCMVGAGLKSR